MSEISALPSGRPSQGGRPITAYLKPSDYCNVGCDHCYLPLAVRANKFRMFDETLDAAISTIRDMVARQRAQGALVVWHGGEPMALPIDYMRSACATVRDRMPAAYQSIQTSLIPFRPEWGDLAHEFFDSQIGSSIDFSQRTIRGDAERFRDFWMQKVELARSDGLTVIPGTVPSRGDLGRGAWIAGWMAENGFRAWNIDRYNSFGKDDPNRPTNREHSDFLTEVFDAVMLQAQHGNFIRVNTITAALGGVLFNQPGDRWGGSCSRDFIVVNPDGSTSACPDKISYESFSNIRDGMDGFEKSAARRDWIRLHMTGHRNSHCATCRFQSFCRSGCPLTPNAPETEGECSGYHRHLAHVARYCEARPGLVRRYLEATA